MVRVEVNGIRDMAASELTPINLKPQACSSIHKRCFPHKRNCCEGLECKFSLVGRICRVERKKPEKNMEETYRNILEHASGNGGLKLEGSGHNIIGLTKKEYIIKNIRFKKPEKRSRCAPWLSELLCVSGTSEDSSWKALNMSMDISQTGSCELLCKKQNEEGCCHLSKATGCTWLVDGKTIWGGASKVSTSSFCMYREKQSCPLTSRDQEGPFYEPGAPERNQLAPTAELTPEAKITVEGVVKDKHCNPISNAIVQAWYAGGTKPHYTFPATNPDLWYRGFQVTDQNGKYSFVATYPGLYDARPIIHIHFKVITPTKELTTQLYWRDDIPRSYEDYVAGREFQFPTKITATPSGRIMRFDLVMEL